MAKHYELGSKGEELAVKYLKKKGYVILNTNWRYKHKEIDIIARLPNPDKMLGDGQAKNDDTLVIVEVKSRSSESIEFESPYDAVTKKKQRFIIEATNAYMQKKDIVLDVRFDIISIISIGKTYKIEHIEDAFYPIVR